jgi:TPR repeat protein
MSALGAGCARPRTVSLPRVERSFEPRHDEVAAIRRQRLASSLNGCGDSDVSACRRLADRVWEGLTSTEEAGWLIPVLARGCTHGHEDACAAVSYHRLLRGGLGLARLEQACEARSDLGCAAFVAARARVRGAELRVIAREAERLCEELGGSVCVVAAALATESSGGRRDERQLQRLYTRACDGESRYGCLLLGLQAAADGDADKARALFGKACARESPQACFALGRDILENEAENPRGRDLVTAACELGEGAACDHLAAAVAGAVDEQRLHYCRLGGGEACTEVALRWGDESSRPEDLEVVIVLLGLGCRGGAPRGCGTLSQLAREAEAACRDDERERCVVSGFIWKHGAEVPRQSGPSFRADEKRAHAAFKKACSLGYAPACERSRR